MVPSFLSAPLSFKLTLINLSLCEPPRSPGPAAYLSLGSIHDVCRVLWSIKKTLPSKSRASSQPAGSGSSELSLRLQPLSHGIASRRREGWSPLSCPALYPPPPPEEKQPSSRLTALLLHSAEVKLEKRDAKVEQPRRPLAVPRGFPLNKRPPLKAPRRGSHGPPCSPPPPYFIPPCPYSGADLHKRTTERAALSNGRNFSSAAWLNLIRRFLNSRIHKHTLKTTKTNSDKLFD